MACGSLLSSVRVRHVEVKGSPVEAASAAAVNLGHIGPSGLRIGSGDRASLRVEPAWAHPASGKQDREKSLSLHPVRDRASSHDTLVWHSPHCGPWSFSQWEGLLSCPCSLPVGSLLFFSFLSFFFCWGTRN